MTVSAEEFIRNIEYKGGDDLEMDRQQQFCDDCNKLFDRFKLTLKEDMAISEEEKMIKINVNDMGNESIQNGNGIYLLKDLADREESTADYTLTIGIKETMNIIIHITTLPIFLDDNNRLKVQKELLKFYGFDVSFEEKDKLIPMNEKCRIINEDYLYNDYGGFIDKYNIKGWERGRYLPRYYRNIKFNLIGKAKHIECDRIVCVIEVEGSIWLINEKGVEII